MSADGDEKIESHEDGSNASSTPSSMTETDKAEVQAFLAWVGAVGVQADDLADGQALLEVLAGVDAELFRNPHADSGSKDSYVVKLGTLKRLYKLMMQYYTSVLMLETNNLPAPDLDELARSSSSSELSKLCRLAIGITVSSEKTKADHITAIQTLSEVDQGRLMVAIDAVMGAVKPIATSPDGGMRHTRTDSTETGDGPLDSATLAASEKARQEAERAYTSLVEESQTLRSAHEDLTLERDELQKEIDRLKEEAHRQKTSGADVMLKGELDQLRSQLRKSEDHLAEAESEVERLTTTEKDLSKKVGELQTQADEAARLKDQVDEYRQMADKAQRTENALEKYKKKLEESAGVRRQLKELEEQNAGLIDRNASLEKEYTRLSDFKPLMESYKSQIDELHASNGRLQEEATTHRYNLEQASLQIKALEEARNKDGEELQLFQERVQELEMGGSTAGGKGESDDDDDDAADRILVGDELDDALKGTTMTDLKLRVHALSRDLKRAKKGEVDSSRIVVLENLLDDANRLKKKYEADYWTEYKQRLRLNSELEKIRTGRSDSGEVDEAAAAHALRLRLAEVVAELDDAKKVSEEVTLRSEEADRDLKLAKADLSLVGKDQVEILAKLRASVAEEKLGLEENVKSLKTDLAASREEAQKLSSQIQGLLMDKINLMEGGWSAKEDELRKEKELGSLRASLAGKSLPKEAEEMLLRLTTDNKALQERMKKAKTFIKQQDKLLKEAQSKQERGEQAGDANANEELAKENAQLRREQELMLTAFHQVANTRLPPATRGPGGSAMAAPPPRSWLGQQQRERYSVSWALGRR